MPGPDGVEDLSKAIGDGVQGVLGIHLIAVPEQARDEGFGIDPLRVEREDPEQAQRLAARPLRDTPAGACDREAAKAVQVEGRVPGDDLAQRQQVALTAPERPVRGYPQELQELRLGVRIAREVADHPFDQDELLLAQFGADAGLVRLDEASGLLDLPAPEQEARPVVDAHVGQHVAVSLVEVVIEQSLGELALPQVGLGHHEGVIQVLDQVIELLAQAQWLQRHEEALCEGVLPDAEQALSE
ncbi:hypothetical protein D3C86_1016610 [compost metagenome]